MVWKKLEVWNYVKANFGKLMLGAFKAGAWFWVNSSPLLSTTEISYDAVKSQAQFDFKTKVPAVTEHNFRTISKENLMKLVNFFPIRHVKWTEEKFDCDDFALTLTGFMRMVCPDIAFGYAQTKTHAFNVVCLDDGVMYLFEPQSNRLITLKEAKEDPQYYEIYLMVI